MSGTTPSESAVPPQSLAVLIPDGREQFHLARAFAPEWLGVLVTSLWTPPQKWPWSMIGAGRAVRRHHRDLEGCRVVSMPGGEIARLLRGRLDRDEAAGAEGLNQRNLAFDRLALKTVKEMRPRAVIAHPSCCLETIRWCRAEGIPAIVALPLAHPATVRRLQAEEAVRRPEYADYWDLATRSAELEARYEEELGLADLVLCPSEFVRRSCVEAGLPDGKLAVVPYGGDLLGTSPGTPDARSAESETADISAGRMPAQLPDDDLMGTHQGPPSSGSAPKHPHVLFVGFLSQRKGIGYLLDAFRALPPGRATLALAGDWYDDGGPYQPLPEGARWLGRLDRPRLAHALAAADIFVLPSLCEGSALVLYEAMAAGLPIVTTFESGPPTTDAAHVALVPAADADALAAAMQRWLDPDALAPAAAAARLHRADWSWAHARASLRGTVLDFLRGGAGRDLP